MDEELIRTIYSATSVRISVKVKGENELDDVYYSQILPKVGEYLEGSDGDIYVVYRRLFKIGGSSVTLYCTKFNGDLNLIL